MAKRELFCAECGKPMAVNAGSLPQGEARCHPCRRARRAKVEGERQPHRRRERRDRVCEVCSQTYQATHTAQRTCGRACGKTLRADAWALRPPKPHQPKTPKPPRPKLFCKIYFPTCVQCGEVFTARHGGTEICSDRCRSARDKRRIMAGQPRQCDCGAQVASIRRKCADCSAITRKQRRARDRRRRRALKMGAASEPYTLAYIAERDRYRCGLCHRKVNMNLAVPHRKAPTVDHIIPLSVGGDDTKANVHLAHFICNSMKSAGSAGEQLLLFG